MAPRDVFGIFVRALGLYLGVTASLSLFNVLWESWGQLPAGIVLRLIATVLVGIVFLFKGDAIALRLYKAHIRSE